MGYPMLKQVVTPIAAAIPDVFPLLEQINTYFDTRYAAIDLADAFSQSILVKTTKNMFLSTGKVSNTPSLSFLKGISTVQPYVIIYLVAILTAFP